MLTPFAALAFPAIDPVALQIGPIALRWYGLAYFAGILLGWLYARRLVADDRLWGGRSPFRPLDIDDLILWVTVGIVLGGRIGYALFYQPGHFLDDPAGLFRMWEGGMSFHGGMAGAILAVVLFARSRSLPVLSLIDVLAAASPFGLFFGRIANFINGELYGRPSDVPWAVAFPTGGGVPRHPSQLYEAALEGLLLFLVLRTVTHGLRGLRFPTMTGGAFLATYGLSRIVVEFFREPDAQLGYLVPETVGGDWLTMGMVLSLPMVLVGLGAALLARRRGAALPDVSTAA